MLRKDLVDNNNFINKQTIDTENIINEQQSTVCSINLWIVSYIFPVENMGRKYERELYCFCNTLGKKVYQFLNE